MSDKDYDRWILILAALIMCLTTYIAWPIFFPESPAVQPQQKESGR
jgi:hypothetical protein